MITDTITQQQSLYERLGASEGIIALVEDIVSAHMENPAIMARFLPYQAEPDKLRITKAHLVAFLCAGSGGAQEYCGRDMPSAHRGMNISEAEYMAALDDILMVLDKHQIDEATKKDMLVIAYSLKDQIIRK